LEIFFSLNILASILQGRADKIKNDYRGDWKQNGGLLVVKKGGEEVLLSYRQENPAEHAENSDILRALGIKHPSEFMQPDPISLPSL
jgi:hypothetical protein